MDDRTGPKTSWVDPELLRLKQEERELFREAHTIFHIVFAFSVISLVLFLLLLVIVVLLHRLVVHFVRKRSLSRLLEKQAAAGVDRRRTSSTFKRLGRPVPQRAGKQNQETKMCSCASVLSFRQDCQNTFRSKRDPVLTNNCCQSKVKTTQETNRQMRFV